ncbi:hypothetical protein PF003_g16007 [Phytophthora fragariae]|nr:hypothetical protein PF003_g16007 [Phytophthora fragariae]
MSMNPSLSVASSKVGIVRRVSVPSGPSDAELLTSLKRTLLITALETPPRFRSDIDVVMIQQHLASLGVFAVPGSLTNTDIMTWIRPFSVYPMGMFCFIRRTSSTIIPTRILCSKALFVATLTKLLVNGTVEATIFGLGTAKRPMLKA